MFFKKKKEEPCASCAEAQRELEQLKKASEYLLESGEKLIIQYMEAVKEMENKALLIDSLHKLLYIYEAWDPYIMEEARRRDPTIPDQEGPATTYLRAIGYSKQGKPQEKKEEEEVFNMMVDTKDGKKYLN